MNLTRKLATATFALAGTVAGLGATATAAGAVTYDDAYTAPFLGGYHSASVDYRSEGYDPNIYIQVWDNGNDNFCSAVEYRYVAEYNQTSPWERTSATCGGNYHGFSIPGGSWGPLNNVRVEFRAVTGNYVGQTISCWAGSDRHNGTQDFCH